MRARLVKILVVVVFVLLAAGFAYSRYKAIPSGLMGEYVTPDEEVYTGQIIGDGISMLTATEKTQRDGVYRRDAHAKTHGCAAATFDVQPLDALYRQGLFAIPKSYKAWIRFSSGSTGLQNDWMPDARGMGIKVLGVDGRKILNGEEDEHTQDFLMINNPVFFIENVKEYAKLTKFQGEGSQFGYFSDGFSPHLSQWHPRAFLIGLGILKFPPRNLLTTQFYSMTPYRLGVQNYVKYSARPVACDASGSVPSSWVSLNRDGLRLDLTDQLKRTKGSCFEFMVQRQMLQKNMPIEDARVEWREKDSPFVPVARITIPRQDIALNLENNFCENLSFTPWHALPEHMPVGGLNRVRKAVYQGISRYRRCKNGVGFGEPKDDGSREFLSQPCSSFEPVPVSTAAAAAP